MVAASASRPRCSSVLVAELGTELHLDGFGGQLFNAAAGGFTGSVASQIATKMAATGASFDTAIGGLDFGAAATNAAYGISALLGSYLGHELVPAQTHEGAVGGQLRVRSAAPSASAPRSAICSEACSISSSRE